MNHVLSRLNIRARFRVVIAIVTASLLALGAWGVVAHQAGVTQVGALFERSNGGTAQVGRLRLALAELRRLEAQAVAVGSSNSVEVQRLREAWTAGVADVSRRAAALPEAEPALREHATRLVAQLDDYAKAVGPVLQQLESVQIDGPVALAYLQQAEDKVQALQATSDALTAAQDAAIAAIRSEMAEGSAAASTLRLVLVGVTLAVFLPLMLWTLRAVCLPLERAVDAARRIAGGDLTPLPPVHGHDETAQLLRALSEMQQGLSRIVGQVRQTAESIQVASAEVAVGNQDLSQRTEQTAGSLQQTASAMQQLGDTVGASAASAREADALARAAADVAARGGSVVGDVVATMEQISGSSRQIADIVGVIDGIAFQTNILALNAAVEAARAGEQGRGFAVVAGEVRALAQRSAEAARQIKVLIGTSVERVEAGARLVGDAGTTMQEIVAGVQRVSTLIGEVSRAADAQSGGLGQVHGAVDDLDRMTQQNAALVEQSAAAAESLKAQAQTLATLVAAFRLEDRTAA